MEKSIEVFDIKFLRHKRMKKEFAFISRNQCNMSVFEYMVQNYINCCLLAHRMEGNILMFGFSETDDYVYDFLGSPIFSNEPKSNTVFNIPYAYYKDIASIVMDRDFIISGELLSKILQNDPTHQFTMTTSFADLHAEEGVNIMGILLNEPPETKA